MLIEALDLWSLATEGTQELNGMESAAVDVEVDIPAVEKRGTGFPYFYLRMHRLYGIPDGLADTFALNTHLTQDRQVRLDCGKFRQCRHGGSYGRLYRHRTGREGD